MKKLQLLFSVVLMQSLVMPAISQDDRFIRQEPLRLSGPRFGVTYIRGEQGELMDRYDISPYISNIGWQFETRWFQTNSGFQGLIETVVLIAGFETEDPVLSGNLLTGFRLKGGFESGIGLNITSSGKHAMVFAIGHTIKMDFVNIPINFAILPSSDALKYSILLGFNIRNN